MTLFNSITVFILAATLFTAFARFRFRVDNSWFLLYYAVAAAFWYFFEGTLRTYWLALGVAAALVLRFGKLRGAALTAARAAEVLFFAYVVWRCVGLFMGWPW